MPPLLQYPAERAVPAHGRHCARRSGNGRHCHPLVCGAYLHRRLHGPVLRPAQHHRPDHRLPGPGWQHRSVPSGRLADRHNRRWEGDAAGCSGLCLVRATSVPQHPHERRRHCCCWVRGRGHHLRGGPGTGRVHHLPLGAGAVRHPHPYHRHGIVLQLGRQLLGGLRADDRGPPGPEHALRPGRPDLCYGPGQHPRAAVLAASAEDRPAEVHAHPAPPLLTAIANTFLHADPQRRIGCIGGLLRVRVCILHPIVRDRFPSSASTLVQEPLCTLEPLARPRGA
mmetsp:Transcript_150088/g.262114  ORF Transcript_150088/g.262114 Transcript_150088/m.262114 type:complete len:282 (+) Transcript_150088:999-1844(+)